MKKRSNVRFLACVQNDGHLESIEPRKLYRVIPDAKAAMVDFVRVIDESGEDYLYPKRWFAPVRVTPPARRALTSV